MTTTMNRSTRSPMTYKPYTLNASTPPYGLWINIPFRTKGSTAIRDEAKTRGARFVPAAKGKMKWWLPQNKFTTETIAWLNTNQMIHGERLAPVFNANALQFSDINTALPFRLWLVVPFAHKDGVKNLGAKWSGDLKKWYFDNCTLTPGIFTNMLANKWAWCFNGTTVSNPGQISEINFSAEDLGEAYPSLNLRKPTAAPAADVPFQMQLWSFEKNDHLIVMCTTADGRVNIKSSDETYVSNIYTKEEARTCWNCIVADGWVLTVTHKQGEHQ
jgi:hypothetical protein